MLKYHTVNSVEILKGPGEWKECLQTYTAEMETLPEKVCIGRPRGDDEHIKRQERFTRSQLRNPPSRRPRKHKKLK